MKKANILKSGEFFMAEGDRLSMLFVDEAGTPVTISVNSVSDIGDNIEEVPDAPVALPASDITSSSFTANWNYMENTLGFYLDVAEDSAFTSMVAGYNNLDVGLVNEYSIIGLDDAIPYYYRLRGYNDYGTGVNSNTITLTTANEVVVDGDGNVYTYVTIGTQQWLVENLKTTKYIDGTAIPNLTVNADWIAEDGTIGHDGAYCWYDNDVANKPTYGALYNWFVINNAHGLAPAGWRVPSDADWEALGVALGGEPIAGGKLKEIGLTHWDSPNTGATNEIGFTARGTGTRTDSSGLFVLMKHWSVFWASDNTDPIYATIHYLVHDGVGLYEYGDEKRNGFCIRLMRDV